MHKEGDQSEYKAIDSAQVRSTLSGSIADDKLLLEQQGLRGDGAHAAGAEEFRKRDEKVNSQEEQIAHKVHVIMLANNRKTAPQGLCALHAY